MDYPINLDLNNKDILIVGGGRVGFRKFKRLFFVGANITVVSREFNPAFDEYFKNDKENYNLLQRSFDEDDLKNKFLVFAATGNRKTNEDIAYLAGKEDILVNIIDNAGLSDFTVPAAHYRGKLLLTASTDSILPALSRKIRKDLEEKYGIEYQLLLEVMTEMRPGIIKKISDMKIRRKIFREIAGDIFLKKVKNIVNKEKITELDINQKSTTYQKAADYLIDEIADIIEAFVFDKNI
ncbi:bifunctional precorrin-2 dehydrogenase/sirohydrochlorin ferrochelatase [Halanaerobium sp. Z-7514]|uniref:precorrin-2 dehydrogenase n=1 Tax=Halanaerobium polyolivorans TaxID=2886943 RepID=A0AAW4X0Z7_9FIRM|nr:bifunctional precorrin-2 dehydrogenase/sirohydrochlorin ferrochelatase [Halanaerobium polyolivorans]MCC3145468.1 bifunctional precorrin-2 dehydrogenase/sirohydrochlorin ferrochelatase [Halanaerobium polyolivorans]